jgi:glycerophosphoryl diester phosphodiesterase
MNRSLLYIGFLLAIQLTSTSCKKIKYYPDKEYGGTTTRFLAHRAGTQMGNPASTIEAIKTGFSNLDGIEVDIQISKDGTLWISHDNVVIGCDKSSGQCFSLLTDSDIVMNNYCALNTFTYERLEVVLDLMSKYYKDSYLSIDFKLWSPCNSSEWNIFNTFENVANEIIELTDTFNLENQVMVESETAEFLDYIKEGNPNIKCFLTAFGDFERGMLKALENGYDGISFQYKFDEEINSQHVELLHRKGLQIQLWTVNSQADIDEAISLKPDFIQTDNLDYVIKLKSPDIE